MRTNFFKILSGMAGAALVAGCSTTDTKTVMVVPITATVVNNAGKTVNSISYQACGEASDQWTPLSIGPIGSGGTARFELPAACVNLQAFYADGLKAGSQTGVRRDFPFTWVIR